eukprot:4157731-Prorocentrum_lima.AAC.1
MTSSLVGSEMCIRDRSKSLVDLCQAGRSVAAHRAAVWMLLLDVARIKRCLLYTSDAADDM